MDFIAIVRICMGWRSAIGRGVWLLVIVLMAIGATGCRDRNDWHQKLTVVVDTPSGQVSGSSVVEVKSWFGQIPPSTNEVSYKIRGEATVVEVLPGRYLFALLGGSKERYYWAVRDELPTQNRGKWLKLIPKMSTVAILEPKNHGYPMLVTFRDINDPKSVREVDPLNLSATFGPGVSLDEITLEITDEPVTEGQIGKLLGWWLKQAKDNRDPPAFGVPNQSPRGYTTVGILEFVRGIDWRQE
ncbi:hypothetical protein [Hoeflea sp. TYP-13]|uniref:hypothetical protein n=1 Tax=Hoeflea sp. TYP-13 TaxID=3230023 RepID=UPI0034C6804E